MWWKIPCRPGLLSDVEATQEAPGTYGSKQKAHNAFAFFPEETATALGVLRWFPNVDDSKITKALLPSHTQFFSRLFYALPQFTWKYNYACTTASRPMCDFILGFISILLSGRLLADKGRQVTVS